MLKVAFPLQEKTVDRRNSPFAICQSCIALNKWHNYACFGSSKPSTHSTVSPIPGRRGSCPKAMRLNFMSTPFSVVSRLFWLGWPMSTPPVYRISSPWLNDKVPREPHQRSSATPPPLAVGPRTIWLETGKGNSNLVLPRLLPVLQFAEFSPPKPCPISQTHIHQGRQGRCPLSVAESPAVCTPTSDQTFRSHLPLCQEEDAFTKHNNLLLCLHREGFGSARGAILWQATCICSDVIRRVLVDISQLSPRFTGSCTKNTLPCSPRIFPLRWRVSPTNERHAA
jgi:hypothetical protein